MSWLSRSIVNSLKLDEDDDDRTDAAPNPKVEPDLDPDQSSPSHSYPSSDPNTPRGVKEDISELTKTLTRQFWGVASFLAPPPLGSSNQQLDHTENEQSLRPPSDGWDEASDEALISGIRSDLSEIGGKFKTEISKLSKNIAVSEFTKMASNFLQLGSDEENLEKYESGNVVGVTEDVVAFARDIAMHPRTWLDFPVPDNDDFDDFDMYDAQQEHALAIERLAPRLAALRIEICPGYMSEGCFWKIYFILLHPQLNEHDAELLSTPQVVAAREMLMPGLQYRAKVKVVEDHSERDTSKITADLPHEESLSLPCSSQSKAVLLKATGSEEGDTAIVVEIETEQHPVQSGEMQVVDKSVIEEEPMKVIKHQHSTSGSSGVSIEKFEDDADDWFQFLFIFSVSCYFGFLGSMGRNVFSDEEDELEVDEEGEPMEGDNINDRDPDDEDEEDEDGQDEYENDGFIVDDVEDEDVDEDEEREDSDEERRKKKKKRKKKEAEDLDEDDYELLRENDVNVPKGSKKFKRLKKARRDFDEEQFGLSDDEFDGGMKGSATAEEKLKRTLFGDDDGQPLEDIAEDEEPIEEEEDGDMGEEDEMADFIVEEDEEHGASVRRKKMKNKKSRHAPDVSSSALKEAIDIFGDVDELLLLRKQGLDSSEQKEGRLEDQFEPTVLSEKYMTEKDDQIRMTDVPERMQISEESTGTPPIDELSIIEESTWIFNQLINGAVPLFGKERQDHFINKDDIMRFLDLTHVQKLDIPFIAMYRKEQCLTLLQDPEQHDVDDDQDKSEKAPTMKWHRVLWAIQDLDRKWLLLQKRKSGLQLHYNKRFEEESRRIYDEPRLNLNQQLFESILKDLRGAESEREVDDVDAKFNLHFPPGEVGVDEGQYKRPKRRSQYSICNKAGLWEVASKFGYSAEQLGAHLSLEKMDDELEDAKETPEEIASNFTCAMFETPQAVLKGARHMAAVEISCEPSAKRCVRNIFMDNAVVSTSPTPDGKIAIDSFHQFAGVKWLREKPLTRFDDAQWLLIQKAEEEKLLQVTIKLPEKFLNKLIKECNDQYLSNGVSKSAQQWNEQRKLILHDALFGFLLPSMEKEARSLLASRAKNRLLLEYGKDLWNKVSVGPYQKKESDVSSDEETAPRVMACCWGPGKPATTFVMLDSSGEVLDVLYTAALTLRSQNVHDQQRKKNDQQRVLKFMTDHQPHVVVLGAVNLSCTRLKDDIYEIIFKMVEENPRDVGHEMDELSIVYGDESLPRLYENSRISTDQLPGQSGIVRRAVALGRYLQNPLAMVATLCGPGKEILSWKLNPMENFLTADEKYGMIEQVLVDVTNQVGLDANLAASHEWLFAPLQFISGLGPRKAASLQRSLVRVGTIFTRKDFLSAHGLDKKVFVNAVAFLRVRRSGLAANSSQFIDLLDDTRIHPESYLVAQELAKDVYDEDLKGDNDDEDALEMAIEHVRDRPGLLKRLRLDNYLKSKDRQNKRETFYDIRRELIQGFQDWRKPYKEPSQDEEFFMISGETEDTLAEGRIVQATVRRVQGGRAICALESGLTGIIMKEDYADDWRDIIELSDRLHEGDILTCKIKSIQKNRYQVFLVCKDSEMRSNRHQHVQNLDPYYHEERSSIQSEQEKARKEKELAKKHFKPRMIVHPRFQNITADEAVEYLCDKEPGESIVRPSSRGPSYLTLTLKVYDGVYAHKEIVEGGKEHKDITSLLRIGKTLKIGEDTFEDLDEVMDRYVDPLVSHLKAMLSYRKFRKGTKSEVDKLLTIERQEYPMRIVYCFGISHEHPGTFILTYIRSTNPHHEYVGLYPKGFKFRKRMFEDIDRLVAYFQRHIDDPQNESAPSIRSVAAMVPMRSPAAGSSAGASTGSGWGGPTNEGSWRGQSFDRGQSSTPGSRTGRNDYRNSSSRDGHPSGAPRPYGGRGRGRGSYNSSRGQNEGQDSSYNGTPKRDSGNKRGEDGLGNFPGAKVQNSPGREAFPGG